MGIKEIYKKIILLIHSLTQLAGACTLLNDDFNEENGEELIKKIDNCEKKFLKVKEEIVIMIKEADKEKVEIETVKTKYGLLISKGKKDGSKQNTNNSY